MVHFEKLSSFSGGELFELPDKNRMNTSVSKEFHLKNVDVGDLILQ